MRAVVLVGGFGTRLRPLTYTTPKPMLPIGHRPMIARLIDRLARGGVTDVVLALGFKPEPFVDAFPDGRCGGVRITYAVEPEPLDTAGAIRFAADAAGIDDTFIVANGDVLTDLDVGALIDAHRRLRAEATIHLIAVTDPSSFGVVDIGEMTDGAGLVRAFVEKPAPGTEPSNLISAGTYVLEPSVLELMRPGVRASIERDVFPVVVGRGGLYGVATDDYWIDAGRPELYLAANLDLLGDLRVHDRCDAIDGDALIEPTAMVRNSIVGAGAHIGTDASVIDSVILPGARIGSGSLIEGSLVMGVVGSNAKVSNGMVGLHGQVADGAELRDAGVPDSAPE
jgi:mannose-1-phosphate guanylyltransferase